MLKTKRLFAPLTAALLTTALLPGCSTTDEQNSAKSTMAKAMAKFQKDSNGVTIALVGSEAKKVRLQVISEQIIRVTATPGESFSNLPGYFMVVAEPAGVPFEVEESKTKVTVKTAAMSAQVDLLSGLVSFYNAKGEAMLSEANRGKFGEVIDEPGTADADSYSVQQSFQKEANEAFFGLGQQQDGLVNYANADVELTTYNMEISIPYLVSSKNYGILWNNAAVSRLGDPRPAAPLAEGFTLYDANGKKGGLTVSYYDGDKLLLTRQELDTNYQFLAYASDREHPFPFDEKSIDDLQVKISGTIEAKTTGDHTLKMYSSGYAKLFIDGELKQDRWRMNWNPWYHNVDLNLKKGEKKSITLDWTPGGGYLRLMANPPQTPEAEKLLTLSSDTGKAVDYYFVLGENKDEVVSGYRTLTGKSVMLPKWVYGFWQSRERYKTQEEIIDNLKEYRERKIPIDNIVLDWSYWPVDAWGSHDFDAQFFPDPKGLVDAVHDLNAHIMISVWPKFYPTTDNYKELNAKGYMFNKNIEEKNLDWIGPGYLNGFYDAYAEGGRDIFWDQINKKINVHGFDAWWLDAVEPDIHSNLSFTHRKDLMTPNAQGTGAEFFNAYALPHAETVYKGDRASEPEKRVFILTRSGFGGIQRTASAIWSGDIVSRWSNLKEQIAAGVGVGMAGMPNWTFDIGGFTPEDRYRSNDGKFVGPLSDMDPAQVAEWQELNARWYQFGAFVPLFRAHGQNPYREIFNIADDGTSIYDNLVWYTKLRYSLMPYIYSQAGDMYHKDGTLMRGLAMDFGADTNVFDINDQYMFGPSLLINPVYEYQAREREVYLPKGQAWFNFYTGERLNGGQTITAKAPLTQMPIFVKAGSIVPTGPEVQHVYDKLDGAITLNVYTGADGEFELYEDDGKSYEYENGAWTRIPFNYNEASKTLTIGDRIGEFAGMQQKRTINIRWISGKRADAADFHGKVDKAIEYSGKAIVVKM